MWKLVQLNSCLTILSNTHRYIAERKLPFTNNYSIKSFMCFINYVFAFIVFRIFIRFSSGRQQKDQAMIYYKEHQTYTGLHETECSLTQSISHSLMPPSLYVLFSLMRLRLQIKHILTIHECSEKVAGSKSKVFYSETSVMTLHSAEP